MANFVVIGVCLILGITFKKWRVLPADAARTLNTIVTAVCLPAIVLEKLRHVDLSSGVAPISVAWILFVASFAFFWMVGRFFHWNRATTGAMIMTGGLGNTSFVGYPLLLALFGASSIATAVLVDQPGSFFVLATLGLVTASLFGARRTSLAQMALRLSKFPPLIALFVAFSLRPVNLPLWFDEVCRMLAAPLIPLALISVGFQLKFDRELMIARWRPLSAGLFFKLMVSPALIYIIFVVFARMQGEVVNIMITEAAMAPMITAAIVAEDFGLDGDLANAMVALGIPLSLLTAPLWAKMLQSLS